MSVDELIRPFADLDLDAFARLSGAERDGALMDVERALRRLFGVRAALIHTVATSGSFEDDGYRTVRSWVQATLNTTRETAGELIRSAAVLNEIPELAAAVGDGRVGSDQLRLLGGLWSNKTCRAQLADKGAALVVPASLMIHEDFEIVLKRWKAHADPDGTHRDHEASRQRRHVRGGVTDHVGIIHAEGDAASVDEMMDILKAHVESEFLKDCDERRLTFGNEAESHPLRRSHGQRCFDAMQEVFRKAARTGVPGVSEPTVNIFTTEADFAAAARDYFAGGAQPPVDQTDRAGWQATGGERFCENEHGSPVDPADMIVAALLGKVRSVIVAEDGRFLQATSRKRFFTGKLRETILLLGRHQCSRHGCELSGPCIQVDHVKSHACGGCTGAANGAPMCPIHNRAKFDLGFTASHDKHGWHHFRPDGTEIAPRGS